MNSIKAVMESVLKDIQTASEKANRCEVFVPIVSEVRGFTLRCSK